MPKNRMERLAFGLLMSYSMAIGMEIYNTALKQGVQLAPGGLSNLTNAVFAAALQEVVFMGLVVLLLSTLFGNRLGAAIGARHCDPAKDSPVFCQLMRQAGTVSVMCPAMSFVASLLFGVILGGAPVSQLFAIWVGTLLKNFPMAFFWNFFAAAPLSRWAFGKLFPQAAKRCHT